MLSRRTKNQILRIITGILLLPLGPVLLMYNENKAIAHQPLMNGWEQPLLYWVVRIGSIFFIVFCLYRIFSAAKLFMMKIPLTYNEIRAGIYIGAILTGSIVSLLCISFVWLYHKPLVSILLVGFSLIMLVVLIFRGVKRKKADSQKVSVKPHQTKDV